MSDHTITTESDIRVTFKDADGPAVEAGVTHIVWLDTVGRLGRTEPVEAGRIIEGRFQCAFFSVVAMSAPVLRAIADLLTKVTAGDDK